MPRQFLWAVWLVDAAAVGVAIASAALVPVGITDLWLFSLLLALSIVHLEINRGVERMRELVSEGAPYVVWMSIWSFAALLLVPIPLVVALVVLTYLHSWLRVGRHILPHRWTYSASTIVIASAIAGWVLQVWPGHESVVGLPAGWLGVLGVVVAAVSRWAVNSGLIFLAMATMTPSATWRSAGKMVFGTPADDLEDFASLLLGALVAVVLTADAPWLIFFTLPLLLMHRGLELRKVRSAARRDPVTGFLSAEVWQELARKQLERSQRLNRPVGYLLVCIDDRLGSEAAGEPLAVRTVAREVGEAISTAVRERDLVTRLHGAEFAVLLPGVEDQHGLSKIADRICGALKQSSREAQPGRLHVTVSIGGAMYPEHALRLDDLMQRAYAAAWSARAFTGHQVRMAGDRR